MSERKNSKFVVFEDDGDRDEAAEDRQDDQVDEHEPVEPVEVRGRGRQQDGRRDEGEDLDSNRDLSAKRWRVEPVEPLLLLE